MCIRDSGNTIATGDIIAGSETTFDLDDFRASFTMVWSGDTAIGWVFLGMQSYTFPTDVPVVATEFTDPNTGATLPAGSTIQLLSGQSLVIPQTPQYVFLLPTNPMNGDRVDVFVGGTIPMAPPSQIGMTGGTQIINGVTQTIEIDTADETFTLTFINNTLGWLIS